MSSRTPTWTSGASSRRWPRAARSSAWPTPTSGSSRDSSRESMTSGCSRPSMLSRRSRFDLAGDNHRSAGNGILDYANAVLRGQPAPLPEPVRDLRYRYPATPEQFTHQVILHPAGPARAAARPAPHHRRPRPDPRLRRSHLRGDLRGPAERPRAGAERRRPRTRLGPRPVRRRGIRRGQHPGMARPRPRRGDHRDAAQHR